MAADRHLLFGLLACNTGSSTRASSWPLPGVDLERQELGRPPRRTAAPRRRRRAAVEALAARASGSHGGDVESSLAAMPAGRSTRESLARLADADIAASLGHARSGFDTR